MQARGKMVKVTKINHKNEKETQKHQEHEHSMLSSVGKPHLREDSLSKALIPSSHMNWTQSWEFV